MVAIWQPGVSPSVEEKACPSAAVTQEEDTRLPQEIWYTHCIHKPVSLWLLVWPGPHLQPPTSITAGTRGTFKTHRTQNQEQCRTLTLSAHGLLFKQEALFNEVTWVSKPPPALRFLQWMWSFIKNETNIQPAHTHCIKQNTYNKHTSSIQLKTSVHSHCITD